MRRIPIIEVKGVIDDPDMKGTTIQYSAARPYESRDSYHGSGLPYPNETIAFDMTPNRGQVVVGPSGEFRFVIQEPNSFYMQEMHSAAPGILVSPVAYITYYTSDGSTRTREVTIECATTHKDRYWRRSVPEARFINKTGPLIMSQEQKIRQNVKTCT
jgi:hypothetical protein